MASIQKRPDGQWRARYRDGGNREHARHFARKADAQGWLDEVTTSVVSGRYVNPKAARRTLRDFGEQWLADQTFDPATRQAVALRWRLHIAPHLGDKALVEIQPSTVRAWLSGLDSLAASYRRVIFANLSGILSAAVDDGCIAHNPCAARSVRSPKADQRKVEPWPTERVHAVIEALPDRYKATAAVAAACGLRQGEVFGLRVCDVDFLKRVVRVDQQVKMLANNRPYFDLPKLGKTRVVPLPDFAGLALAEHLRHFPAVDGLIFTSRERQPMNRNYINAHVWKPALRLAGVEPTRHNGMHALRHYFASVLIDAGESAKVVAEYLGHADPGFTLRVYAHLFPASEDRARRVVDAALAVPANCLRSKPDSAEA